MFLNSYSERTKCPACKAKVRLEDVRFTPTFLCPACQKEIQVSTLYLKTLGMASSAVALLVAYIIGAHIPGPDRFWLVTWLLVLLLWVPLALILTFVSTFLWTYIVKYWLPPKLLLPVSDPDPPNHFQGLDLGPK
jgi:hypothetical protein